MSLGRAAAASVDVVDLVDLTTTTSSSPSDSNNNGASASAAAAAGVASLAAAAAKETISLLESSSDDDDDDGTGGFFAAAAASALTHRKKKRQRMRQQQEQHLTTIDSNSSVPPPPPAGRFKTDRDATTTASSPVVAPAIIPAPVVAVLPEHTVLEYFPDADLAHVQQLLKKYHNPDTGKPNMEVVINQMMENPYPKCKDQHVANSTSSFLRTPAAAGGGTGGVAAAAGGSAAAAVVMRSGSTMMKNANNNDGGGAEIDWMSTESFTPEYIYCCEAQRQLEYDFPFLSVAGAKGILTRYKFHYAIAHDHIVSAIKGTTSANTGESLEESQYNRLLTAMSGNKIPADQKERVEALNSGRRKACLASIRKKNKPAPTIRDDLLQQEVSYVKHKVEKFLEQGRLAKKRKRDQEQAQKNHTAVDCSCCFDGFPVQDMVACREEGHLFCVDCLKLCAENQIFGQGNLGIDKRTKKPCHELQCFHGDGCSSGFDRELLQKALNEKTLAKYDELQFKVSLEAAGLADIMFSCPKCDFQAELPVGQKVFTCPVADCRFESCRECRGPSHIPLRCEEVKKEEKETKGRLTVEEAISEAKIRKCYKCRQPFVKSEGCNKITCGCGAKQCYVCRQAISDYSHFCQTFECKHVSCNKCPLYSKAEEDDARAMREAGLKAAQDVRVQNEREASMQVDIDVDSILKKPPAAAAPRRGH